MNRLFIYILFAGILVGQFSCASKRYAKKGMKFEQAGMYELAADAYMNALDKKPENVDAIIGLRRSSQRVIDDFSKAVLQGYEEDNMKVTVNQYLKADSFKRKVAKYNIELQIPETVIDAYNDVKPRYLSKLYSEGKTLLEAENFKEAQNVFAEIIRIDPDYEDVKELFKTSYCEPLYREAKQYTNNGKFRKAYAQYNKIMTKYTDYKDTRELREEALINATLVIKVKNFVAYYTEDVVAQNAQNALIKNIKELKNPFIKILDSNTSGIVEEQKKGLVSDNQVAIGKLLAPKAILNGSVSLVILDDNNIESSTTKGYLKKENKYKDPKTKEEKVEVTYEKVIYVTYKKRNAIRLIFEYKLTSVETGEILLTNVITSERKDEVQYARFNGPTDKLVPGYWEKMDASSPKDVINDNPESVGILKALLQKSETIKDINTLTDYAINDVVSQAASEINRFNPEEK